MGIVRKDYEKEQPEWTLEQKLWRLLGFFFIQAGTRMTRGEMPRAAHWLAEEIRKEAEHW